MGTPAARALLAEVFAEAVRAVGPARVVPPALARLPLPSGHPHVIALGKAAPGMARAARDWLQARGLGIAGGVVVHAGDAPEGDLDGILWIAGDHPVPADRSRAAAGAIAEAVARVRPGDDVLVLVSGGTSSLAAAPAPGAGTTDLAALFEGLLGSGEDIRAMNAVRRRALRWGDGRLADALRDARVGCVVLGDVPGGGPHAVGSGPCDRPWVTTVVAADPRTAAVAAAAAARSKGWDAVAASADLAGEASRCGRRIAGRLLALAEAATGGPVRCLAWGGETTVALGPGAGRGGRNQELALAAAEVLAAHGAGFRVALLAAGTDGRDGPTDAAGAVVDGRSWPAIRAAEADPAAHLARHDSHPALEAAGLLLRTGPTGTNVADLAVGLVEPG